MSTIYIFVHICLSEIINVTDSFGAAKVFFVFNFWDDINWVVGHLGVVEHAVNTTITNYSKNNNTKVLFI